MKTLIARALALVFLVTATPLRADPAPPVPPDLKLLDQFAGNWRYDFTVHKAEWAPEEKHGTGTFTCQWIVGNRFLEEKGTEDDGTSHLKIFSYDAKARVFRTWWFASIGIFNDSTSKWDAEKHTFIFTTLLPTGQNGTATLHFTDEKTVEWEVIFQDGAKVYFHSRGKSLRQ